MPSDRMIVILTQNFLPDVGGTQQYVTGLADALCARGHAVAVLCDQTSRSAARTIDTARAYSIRRFSGPRFWRMVMKARVLGDLTRRGEVAAVITDTWKSLEMIPGRTLEGVHVLCLGHGNEFLPATHAKADRIRASLAKATLVAANSNFTADIAGYFTAPTTSVEVLWPGITPPAHAPRGLNGTDKASGMVLSIARLEPRKGIDQLIRAVAALTTVVPDISLHIIGKGDDRPRLEALAAELGVTDRVVFHGYVSETRKAELLAQASVFALPNRREPGSVEGFGMVFLEAAAYGTPAIAGADGGTADAVIDNETGLVVDGEDTHAVTQAIGRLLGDEDLCQRLGTAAHQRFWSRFDWDVAVERFEAALGLS